MPVHIHTLRASCAGALGVILAAILLNWAYSPAEESRLVPVTGRVTCGDPPLGGMWVMFEEDAPRGFTACAEIRPDGSFRMQPWGNFDHEGVRPGNYRVRFVGRPLAAVAVPVAPKYQSTATSGLLVHVGPAWNEMRFSLPDHG